MPLHGHCSTASIKRKRSRKRRSRKSRTIHKPSPTFEVTLGPATKERKSLEREEHKDETLHISEVFISHLSEMSVNWTMSRRVQGKDMYKSKVHMAMLAPYLHRQ